MFRPLARTYRCPPRRGTSFVLIVVVMISLAASVGVAFALFAGQTLRISRAHLDGQGGGALAQPRPPEPASTLNRFFSALLFDAGDDAPEDLTNSLRGHSIARSMYGRDPFSPTAFNTTPWAGTGLFREDTATYTVDAANTTPFGFTGDRSRFVNYTQMLVGGNRCLLDPEMTGHRASTSNGWPADFATSLARRSYIGRHAGYSFADLKDFFAGSVDAATGQVLTPSFHRPWMWNTTVGTTTYTLDPNNPNWYNPPTPGARPEGRMLTLRPRPAEHPLFPRVPPNADGTYTGDVQNWPGGYTLDPATGRYHARNDSLWMHIGLPPVQFGNRKVQPLVAPLIVPLDGLFNANAHGNIYGPNSSHISHTGYGPWEVNIAGALGTDLAALPTDWATVIRSRGNAAMRNGATTRPFDPSHVGPLPSVAPVAWNGTAVTRPGYPTANSLAGVPPGFLPPAPGAGFQFDNVAAANHPSLYNPTEWAATGTPRAYPLSDIKRLQLRYAFHPDWYATSDLASAANAPTDLLGTAPYVYATGVNTHNAYRLDQAHSARALFTTRGFSLDRPKIAPNFINRDGALGLAFTNATLKPGPVSPGAFPAPGTSPRGTTFTDFPADNRWVNQMAALGSVNINRPLADYRTDTTRPLTTTNITVATAAQADSDRRKLAHDIFLRLAVATGAALDTRNSLTPTTYPLAPLPQPQYALQATATVGTLQFEALRYLAQLAVNIVDYRDDDDISTVFVWNPLDLADPYNAANFGANEVNNRVVFGVEKPRVVINEVYSELTNDPRDPVDGLDQNGDGQPDALPNGSLAHVKFWAELLNPTVPANATNTGTVADSVLLTAYQIQIARANRITGGAAEDRVTPLLNPGNSIGSFGGTPDATFSFVPPFVTNGFAAGISPNNNNYAPPAATLPPNGVVLVAPRPSAAKAGSAEYNPQAAGVWADGNTIRSQDPGPAGTSTGMGYTLNMGNVAGTVNPATAEFRHHVVLLRRVANPYLPSAALNPYVTVDMVNYVPSWDVLHRDIGQGMGRQPRPGNVNGYDPANVRFSVGKVQAYAGQAATTAPPANGAGMYNAYTFPTSMVLDQRVADATGDPTAPRNTWGRHNGTAAAAAPANTFTPGTPATLAGNETIMTPFDWMIHPDRTLVNEIELFQVRDTPAYRVTDRFLMSSAAAPGVTYEAGFAPWRFTDNGLARALEYLTVKPFTANVAHGGRAPGKVGINALNDKRVLAGLLDPQAGNAFDANFVTNNAWNQWFASRNGIATRPLPNGTGIAQTAGAPGQTVHEGGVGGTNRPFLPLGGPAVAPNGFAYPAGATENDTILRHNGTPTPLLYTGLPVNGTVTAYGAVSTPQEPLQKVMNNILPTSHTYAVFLTIGYFELDTTNGLLDLGGGIFMPRFAQEAYTFVPGDLRQKFFAVIDMSGMAIDPTTNGPAANPFHTTLTDTARAGTSALSIVAEAGPGGTVTVTTDGVPIEIRVGTQLVVGYGVEEQLVTVQTVTPPTGAGLPATVGLAAPLARTAWGGASVSNARPGYPGVQGANFRYNDVSARPVLPFVERVK